MRYDDLDRPPLDERAVSRALVGEGGFWREVRVVAETGSTNADVAELATSGAPEGVALVAEQQTAGRGRLDRTWQAPARSGLTFSVLLRPRVPAERWGWLPLLAGSAARAAIAKLTNVDVKLKWPNDLIVETADETRYGKGRKLGGILVERVETPQGPAAVVGMGINVTLTEDELPAPHATSLTLANATMTDRDPLLRAVLRAIATDYQEWEDAAGDPDASGVRAAYLGGCGTIGRRVKVELPGGGMIEGEASDVDGAGRLVLRTVSGLEPVGAGDVVHLR